MKIYKTTDKIKIKINDLFFYLSPLSYKQKIDLQNLLVQKREMEASIMAVRMSLKDVEGLETSTGEKYELSFENELVSEDSIDDILNLQGSSSLQLASIHFMTGVPKEILNPVTGLPIEGVKIVGLSDESKKKKR